MKITGNDMKAIRKFFGMTQAEFSSMIQSRQTTVSRAERLQKEKYLSEELCRKIERALKEKDMELELILTLVRDFNESIKNKNQKEID